MSKTQLEDGAKAIRRSFTMTALDAARLNQYSRQQGVKISKAFRFLVQKTDPLKCPQCGSSEVVAAPDISVVCSWCHIVTKANNRAYLGFNHPHRETHTIALRKKALEAAILAGIEHSENKLKTNLRSSA